MKQNSSTQSGAWDMSLSAGRLDGSWSLSTRLTLWHACAALALVVAATAVLYSSLVRALDLKDDAIVRERLGILENLLREHGIGDELLMWEVVSEPKGMNEPRFYLRILDGSRNPVLETPGMEPILPVGSFRGAPGDRAGGQAIDGQSRRKFRTMTAAVKPNADSGEGYLIQAAYERTSEEAILRSFRFLAGGSLAVCAILSLAIGKCITLRVMRPLTRIAQTAGRIGGATLHERIPTSGLPVELSELAVSFNRMLERLSKSFARLSLLSADMAHELRTPLNRLRGNAEVALIQARSVEEYQDVLQSCLEECGNLATVINSLIFLARSESSEKPITLDAVDPAAELKSIVEFYEPIAAEKRLALDTRMVMEPGLQAMLDRILFRQAVSNLMSNAISYTPGGGTVRLTAMRRNSSLSVGVEDTGIGIAAEHLPHIFDRFYRVDRARRRNTGGMGLGLSIVKTIMDLHKGSVEVFSQPGGGTRMTLVFPLGQSSDADGVKSEGGHELHELARNGAKCRKDRHGELTSE